MVSVGDVTVTEGGAATFTVTMTGAIHETGFNVSYGRATATPTPKPSSWTDDFTGGLSGTVMIAARARSARFTIQTWDDELAEDAETFTCGLSFWSCRNAFDHPRATGSNSGTEDGDGNDHRQRHADGDRDRVRQPWSSVLLRMTSRTFTVKP